MVTVRNYTFTGTSPLFLIGGPCVIESEALVRHTAEALRTITDRLKMPYIFKASFDKANRTSATAFRGPGLHEGLKILEKVKTELNLPILTDVHEDTPIDEVAQVIDVIQTPAFLARQTGFIERVARAGRPVNIKKGQFQAPWDMQNVVDKYRHFGNDQLLLCDRGTSFGYNTLISDMRGLAVMRQTGCPVVFDATHSVQEPGGLGACSGGKRQMVPVIARAAVGAGVSGLFMEIHPNPDEALCDGPNSWPLDRVEELLKVLIAIDSTVKSAPFVEDTL
ncbi:MAG: 3-deoxy-8-phosphooctulonate synthase [Deltaproteobacteria bacterium]|nr:3-deoxy-8-phosphooctulonate synthase [Deltaproteobacteria bacterium]